MFVLFALLGLAKYNLARARFTETFSVTASSPGASLTNLERDVAEPLEKALSQVKGLDALRTVTTTGVVAATFSVTSIGTEAMDPMILVHEALTSALPFLPEEVGPPIVQRLAPSSEVRHFVARSETMSRLELSRWLDEGLRREVEVQPGVRAIRLCGALEPELKIILDQPRLRAFGVPAGEVIKAVEVESLDLPAGRIGGSPVLTVRAAKRGPEELQGLALGNGKVKLSDVATFELGGEPGPCVTGSDVVVSVTALPEARLRLPELPSVKLIPFKALRTATFASAPGNSVQQTLYALARLYPGALVMAEGDQVSVLFSEEPKLVDLPGIALRSMDDRHAVVQVSGPDFKVLSELAEKLREALAKEPTRWLGMTWPSFTPEQAITPEPGVKGVAQALRLAMGGVVVGKLSDGTPIRIRAGTSIEDAELPDGRPVREVVVITSAVAPGAMLRVDRQRTIELEVGLAGDQVERVVRSVELPSGYSVRVR